MRKKGKNKKINYKLSIFFKVQAINLVFYLSLLILLSVLLYNFFDLNEKAYFYIAVALLSSVNIVTGYYTGIKLRKNGLLNALIFSLPATFTVILLSVILNSFHVDLTLIISLIIMLCSSMLGGVSAVNTSFKVKR